MKKQSLKHIFGVAILLISQAGFAADWDKINTGVFTLPPPPKAGSSQELNDVDQLLKYQNANRSADCQLAKSQQSPGFRTFFGPTANILSAQETARIEPIMIRIGRLVTKVTDQYKQQYHRPRPYDAYPEIKPCIPEPGGSKSYPSAHAAVAEAQACVLAKVFADRAQRILDYGEYLGRLRNIAGVHYPIDVQAGQDIGNQVCKTLMQDRSFVADLKALSLGATTSSR